jgi:hypothetical protein
MYLIRGPVQHVTVLNLCGGIFSHFVYVYLIRGPVQHETVTENRVATAAFWRTFHHEGKISLAGKGGGCTPTPFHYYYHHQ